MKRRFSQFYGAGLILLQFICLAFAGDESNSPVYITELIVPNSVQNGTEKFVILDCKYLLNNSDSNEINGMTGLVVTWSLNSSIPIYQWVYGQKPQGLGVLDGRLDLSYNPSKIDYEMHRALKIIQPTINLSGDYTCRVSNFAGSALRTARMIVFVAAKEMRFNIVPSSSPNSINVSCYASGVFPEPRLSLFYGTNGENRMDQIDIMTSVQTDSTYDISIHKIIYESNLTLPTHFNCDLKIPNTSYYVRKDFIHKGPGSLINSDADEGGGSNRGQPQWFNYLLCTLIMSSFEFLT